MTINRLDHDNFSVLEIDHPRRGNSLGSDLGLELHSCLEQFEQDRQKDPQKFRLLAITAKTIIKADRNPIWIAGGDLKELSSLSSAEQGSKYAKIYQDLCL